MEENPNDNRPRFSCYQCKHVTYYNPSDYIDEEKKGKLLMEMLIYKTKQVTISCSNPVCRVNNVITIKYL